MGAILAPFVNLLSPGTKQIPAGRLRIDWRHPLANKLVGCWLPAVYGGIDLTGNSAPLTPQATPGIMSMTRDGAGHYADAATTTTGYSGPAGSALKVTNGAFSVYWRGYQVGAANGGTNDLLICVSYSDPGSSPWTCYGIGRKLSGTEYWSPYASSGANFGNIVAKANNTFFSLGVAFTSNGGANNLGGYSSGVRTLSSTAPTSTTFTATSPVVLNVYGPNCICNIGLLWTRQLTDAEMAWLDAEPYGFLLPDEGELSGLKAAEQLWQLFMSKNAGAYEAVTTTSTSGVRSADASSDADDTKILVPRL